MKRLLGNLFVFAVTLALAGLAGEVVVRAAFKKDTVLYPRYHTDYHYGKYTLRGIRPAAHFWHTSVDGTWLFVTNDHGLRDSRNFTYDKPAGTFRVLSLGDSHTQGYEVRQDATFSAVLERYLRGHSVNAQVLNAGVSGYSTAEELAYLVYEGYKYRPDVVVVGFYANDFDDNLKAELFALDDKGALVDKSYSHIPGVKLQNAIYAVPGVRWLSENSYFYSLLFNNVWAYFKAKLTRSARFEYAVADAGTQRSKYEVDLTVALLERMKRFCDEHKMRLIVVDIPARAGDHKFESSVPERMRQALAASGIELVDSRAVLGEFDGAAEFHVPHGHNHISELTHALIGVQLGERIVPRAHALQANLGK
jgi:GDSL-like lipase/acylhydrolase family protein